MKTIAAFIPVYKQPKNAASLASSLSAEEFEGSETVVMVDGETTPGIALALEQIRQLPRVRVIEGVPHLGKAAALYRAVAASRYDNIIVLDNDVALEPGVELFKGCSSLLESNDLVELPKAAVGKGPVAAMMKYEFLSNIIGTTIISRKTGRCPSMNGAAFAVRRKLFVELKGLSPIINDDTDFAARAMLAGARFTTDPSVRVLNEVPETPGEWLKQRKRWATGFGLWSTTYLPKLRKREPRISRDMALSSIPFAMPFMTTVLALVMAIIGPGRLGGGLGGTLIVVASFLAFLLYGSYFSHMARYYGQKFNWISYVFFALIYCPIWAISSTLGSFSVKLNRLPKLDWVYGASKQDKTP
ncbi:MAG: glycosyltransferase family 2 protein [Spirochaetaceae bacterium]|nr:glycosyltransferase family 2 protein [Spirochaetaceae bacterium]